MSLAGRYYEGRGVARSEAEALRWWKLSADQGDAQARENLAMALEVGADQGRGRTERLAELKAAARRALSAAPGVGPGLGPGLGRGVGVDGTERPLGCGADAVEEGEAWRGINTEPFSEAKAALVASLREARPCF